MNLADPTQLKMHGEFQERLLRAIGHLQDLNNDEMRMEFTHPNDFWHWGADYMGRWIASMALLGRYTGQDYGVDAVVDELLAFQNADGSFGPYTKPHDFQEWFGMGRGLTGLLEVYQTRPDPKVLEAALRLADYYAEHYPECAPFIAECYSNALEGLVLLYRLAGREKDLETARWIAETSVVYDGTRFSQEFAENGRRTPASGQVHCQLSTARGLLDLYETTGETRFLQPVLDLHRDIEDQFLWISGGLGFYYYRPEENETCADADWLRLNLQLWRLTGEVRYMNLAERILLNQIFFNQADNGAFCYLRGLQNRAGAAFDACCSHHGPRAFYEVLRYAYTSGADSAWANLYLDGDIRLDLDGSPLGFSVSLERSSGLQNVRIQVSQAPEVPAGINLRIPDWAGEFQVLCNGQVLQVPVEAGYACIERAWAAGDLLELRLPMHVRLLQGQTLGKQVLRRDEMAVFYGPRLFCLNDDENPALLLHLVRLDQPVQIIPVTPDRLEGKGSTPDNPGASLVFTPLAEVGGTPSGAGRIHTMRSPVFRVWIPVDGSTKPNP
jgi:DUF1680 family protein